MNKSYLLSGKTAKALYKYAKKLSLIDFHNHLSVSDITTDKRFTDIYDLWIKPDPYKHRAMRMCGVPEYYITGDAPNSEKFEKWWETIPNLAGNPLYLWSKMELSTVFGIKKMPKSCNAKKMYKILNEYLCKEVVTVNTLLDRFNVEYLSPCTSLLDNLEVFDKNNRTVPSLRGDDIVKPTMQFLDNLQKITGMLVEDIASFEKAVCVRLDYFSKYGCSFSDHALDNGFKYFGDDGKNSQRFDDLKSGNINIEDSDRLSSYILTFLSNEYAKRGWVMQLHIGAQRYTSTKLLEKAGPAGGYAAIGNSVDVVSLTKFFDTVDLGSCGLPKTVIYTLNPSDNALISVLSGSYAKDNVPGLITQGSAWWWCDHAQGISEMIDNAMSFGVFSNFLGMTTDSRSFLSFVRHDYFRRILCSKIAQKAESGELPENIDELKEIIYEICYKNAKNSTGGTQHEF